MAVTYTTINNLGNTSGTITVPNGGSAYTGSSITLNSGAGTSNQWLTSGSSSTSYTTTWANPNTNFNDGTSPVMTIPYGTKTIEVNESATLDVKGNVKINGIDLEERLKTIERLLLIPERDVTMEAKYPSLKKKYDEYINALEKYRTFERIKGDEE